MDIDPQVVVIVVRKDVWTSTPRLCVVVAAIVVVVVVSVDVVVQQKRYHLKALNAHPSMNSILGHATPKCVPNVCTQDNCGIYNIPSTTTTAPTTSPQHPQNTIAHTHTQTHTTHATC